MKSETSNCSRRRPPDLTENADDETTRTNKRKVNATLGLTLRVEQDSVCSTRRARLPVGDVTAGWESVIMPRRRCRCRLRGITGVIAMQCVACGTEVPSQAAFCPKCGEPVQAGGPGKQAGGEERTAAERFRDGTGAAAGTEHTSEDVLWQGNYSGRAMLGSWLLVLLVTAALIGVGVWLNDPTAWMVVAGICVAAWAVVGLVMGYRKVFRPLHSETGTTHPRKGNLEARHRSDRNDRYRRRHL